MRWRPDDRRDVLVNGSLRVYVCHAFLKIFMCVYSHAASRNWTIRPSNMIV